MSQPARPQRNRTRRVIVDDSDSESPAPAPAAPPTRAAKAAVSYAELEEDADELDDDEDEEDGEGEDDDAEGSEEEDGEEEDAEGEDDAEGEEEDDEIEVDDGMDVDAEGEDEDEVEEDADGEDDEAYPSAAPSPAVKAPGRKGRPAAAAPIPAATPMTNGASATGKLKIKLNLKSSPASSVGAGPSRPVRGAAKKGKKGKKADEGLGSDEEMLQDDLDMDDFDEFDSALNSRATSPSKLTARQRARHNKDLQDTLLALPDGAPGKKQVVLTEAERLQKREETARRRKRQTEQKLQDEQDETINRLLRAQTGRSRAKLDGEADDLPSGGGASPTKRPRREVLPKGESIRWSSSLAGDSVVVRVGVPEGKEAWIAVSQDAAPRGSSKGPCGVSGCGKDRKYRSTLKFEMGGCCLEHLNAVNDKLRAVA